MPSQPIPTAAFPPNMPSSFSAKTQSGVQVRIIHIPALATHSCLLPPPPATSYTTYCTDSVCCGLYNCTPTGADCCSNGQYCIPPSACELVDGEMICQCAGDDCNETDTAPSAQRAMSGAVAATAAASSSTSAPSGSSPSSSQNGSGGGQGPSPGVWAAIGSVAGVVSAAVAVWVCICYKGLKTKNVYLRRIYLFILFLWRWSWSGEASLLRGLRKSLPRFSYFLLSFVMMLSP
jgi:hypothetical protein